MKQQQITLSEVYGTMLEMGLEPGQLPEVAGVGATVLAAYLMVVPADHFITQTVIIDGWQIEVTARYVDGISPAERLIQLEAELRLGITDWAWASDLDRDEVESGLRFLDGEMID